MACIVINQAVQAQVKFYTVVSESSVAVRQTFQVQYVIENAKEIKEFDVPYFRDFLVQEDFEMHNSSNVNGKSSIGYFKIIILSPKRGGRFTIPGATAVIDGKKMTSNQVKVEVRQTGLSSSNNLNNITEDIDTEQESVLHPGEDISEKIRKNFFLKVHASKTNCFVGEPLMVVYKAYSRLNANSQVVKRPSLTGFSVLEMVDTYDGKPEIEKLNGNLYYTNIIRKVQLFPLQEGNFVLDPAEIESVIQFVKKDSKDRDKTEAEKFFNNREASVIQYRTILRTEPQTITVKALPKENQPAGFRGAVGNYSLNIQVPREPIRAGDLVKIQLVINGSGNLSLLSAPDIDWPVGVDTADPVVKENFNKYAFPLTGSKIFEYSFAAPDTGDYIIPGVELPYYDPKEKTYKKATTEPVTMHVLASNNKEELENKLDAISKENNGGLPRHLYWFGLVVLVIAGTIIYQAFFRDRNKQAAETKDAPPVVKEVPPPPKPTAAEMLAEAKSALQQGKKQLFYHSVEETLWKVVAEKCAVAPSALNKENVKNKLLARGVEPAVVQNLSLVLDVCEWALYTPDTSQQDMEKILHNAEDLIQQITVV